MKDHMNQAFDYFLEHHDELVAHYNGRVVAIKDGRVLGAYDTEHDAVVETMKHEAIETFIVQRVTPGDEAYTIHVNALVVP